MHVSSPAFLAIVALILPAQTLAQSAIVHPNSENLEVAGLLHKMARRDTVSGSGTLNSWARKLRNARRVDSIGTLDGDIETVLGMIRDVVVTGHGDIFVLDRANRALRVFGSNGSFKFAVGREGGGPTDLRTPVSAWESPGGEVAVFDAALGLKFFSISADGVASLHNVVHVGAAPTSACSAKTRIFALVPTVSRGGEAIDVEKTVRVYDAKGALLSTFGDGYKSPVRLVRMMMSEGAIGCSTDGTVLVALSKLPFVHSYDSDGKLRWTIQFRDFTVGRHLLQRNKAGQAMFGLDPKSPTNSFTLQIREFTPGYVAVQIGLMTPASLRNRTIWERVDTYLIETATGEGVYVSASLPMIAGLQGATRLVGYRNDPYPQVEILQIR